MLCISDATVIINGRLCTSSRLAGRVCSASRQQPVLRQGSLFQDPSTSHLNGRYAPAQQRLRYGLHRAPIEVCVSVRPFSQGFMCLRSYTDHRRTRPVHKFSCISCWFTIMSFRGECASLLASAPSTTTESLTVADVGSPRGRIAARKQAGKA